jgi:hypothetical protein
MLQGTPVHLSLSGAFQVRFRHKVQNGPRH